MFHGGTEVEPIGEALLLPEAEAEKWEPIDLEHWADHIAPSPICVSKTPISEEHGEASIAGALAVAGRFGLKAPEAKSILGEVFTAVAAWRRTAKRLRLKGPTVEAYASAFEQELTEEARRLLAK